MAKIFLRVYNREIESMIEGGQLDEAVAHCQYILKTFPMHVDTYRLLGKAFLEARRYADAADIFQRVLMAVPDDFVSHVGMSIIRDDENKMDDAIWHMERAFEVQPSNSAIQGELRRLYGRRDGVEPSKIRLSRDALANMYSQGELFNQAIAEIRSVLAEDNNRPDLQVMLARAYYRSGQKVEAAEMAAALLKKYPYCMDSLRVLVDVLPGTARAENTQVYRQRLHNLDPYSSFTVNSVFASDQVSDSAVSLERLDYKSSSSASSSQPDWASSLGIKLNDEKQADNPPAWMQTTEEPGQPAVTSPEPASTTTAAASPAEADKVPEWMRSAGWQESDGATQSGTPDSGELSAEEPIAKADIPEWLKSMAPTEASEEAKSEPEGPAEVLPVGEDGIPEWLKPTGSIASAGKALTEPQQSDEPPAENSAGVPDWLAAMAPAAAAGEAIAQSQSPDQSQQASAEPQAQNPEEIPAWLTSMAPATAGEHQVDIDTTPQPIESQPVAVEPQAEGMDSSIQSSESMAPLAAVDEGHNAETAQPVEPQPVPVEPQPANTEEFPDWLKSLSPTEPVGDSPVNAEPPVESQLAPDGVQPTSTGDFPDWLESLSPNKSEQEAQVEAPQPVESQPTPAEPQPANAEDAPDWFESLDSTEAVGNVTAGTPLPVEAQQAPVEAQPTGADDVFDWLKSLDSTEPGEEKPADTVQQPAEPQQEPVEPAPASTGGVPDWFKSLTPANQTDEVAGVAVQPSAESQNVGMDATPDWLKPLAPAKAEEEAPVVAKAENEEGIPDWLKSMAPVNSTAAPEGETEPAPVEPASVGTEPEPIPAEPSTLEAGVLPDWQSVGGSRADAAALTAKAMEQPAASEKPESILPLTEEPPLQGPVQPSIPPARTPIGRTVDESFQPTGEVKPLNIGDDAFSWLESLAAKQGAKPEELLTNPEERSAEMPDWLRQTGEKPADVPEPPTSMPSVPASTQTPPETLPLEPLAALDQAPVSEPAEAAQSAEQPVTGKDDTMAWLETLGSDQETKPEEPSVGQAAYQGTTTDWNQKVQEDQPVIPAMENVVPTVPEPAPAQEDISITSWLSKLDVDEALAKKSDEIPAEAAPAASSEELPDWLKDLEKPTMPTAPVETPKVDNDLPDWLRHPIPSESLDSVAPSPVSDSASEPEQPIWADENISAAGETSPTMPEEWLPAETKIGNTPIIPVPIEPTPLAETTLEAESRIEGEVSQTTKVTPAPVPSTLIETEPAMETPQVAPAIPPAEPAPIPVQSPAARPTLKQTGMLSHIPSLDKDAELLNSAQNVLDQNSLDDAMKKYSKLIRKGRLLDEVIHDLREAIYRYPVDVIVWQTLGDAYMRANRLQDALDAYTKAEELLR